MQLSGHRFCRFGLGLWLRTLGACCVLAAEIANVGGVSAQIRDSRAGIDDDLVIERQWPAPIARRRGTAARAGLTVVSWDLSDAVAAGLIYREKRKKRVWRNTFVPRERAIRHGAGLPERLRDADIVLMQSVRSMREVRRLFPARGWKVIISRNFLKVTRGRGPFSRVIPEGFATTAIAIRYRLGLRVTGQEHLLNLVGPSVHRPAGGNDAAESAPVDGRGQPGLAVRVFHSRKVMWLVSVVVPDGCNDDETCDARKSLDAWVEDKRDFDIPVVIGGRLLSRASRDDKDSLTRDPHVRDLAPSSSENSDGPRDAGAPVEPKTRIVCQPQDLRFYPKREISVEHDTASGCFAIATMAAVPE